MRSIGLFEAKNRLSALVESASRGETIIITRRGQNAAMLVPISRRQTRAYREVVEHIRESRKGVRVPEGFTIRRLIEEGRQP